jgi:SAM-dependent methyltransferase
MDERFKTSVAANFSRQAGFWSRIYDPDDDIGDEFYADNIIRRKAAVLGALDDCAGGASLKLLDVGCGPGVLMGEALQRGHTVIGTDLSEKMLRRAQTIARNHVKDRSGFVLGDIERLPFKEGAFDAVLCIGVLSYLREDTRGVLEISRVTRPGGLVIIALPNLFRLTVWLDPLDYVRRAAKLLSHQSSAAWKAGDTARRKGETAADEIKLTMRMYRYNQWMRVFRAAGLIQKKCIGLGYGPLTLRRKPILPMTASLRISHLIEGRTPGKRSRPVSFFANHWVIVLKKRSADPQPIRRENRGAKRHRHPYDAAGGCSFLRARIR